jgi:NAD(P)-dependent dehydrogenase (short-subunit alcohol dehydrogenase family)
MFTSVQQMIDEILNESGRIDLLVNNAGVGLLGGTEESSTTEAKARFSRSTSSAFSA